MNGEFVVVDGSNIATEGRSTPSLVQLDEAVREFQEQFPDKKVIVVVDATFGHRIQPGQRPVFEEALENGEIVSPPAGAIGRGDAFLLRVAERVRGQVLSNDSFQEFHGEHPWLFEDGRLMGATPVPGVGWIFSPRSPVRGPRSRAARAARADLDRLRETLDTTQTGNGTEPAKRADKAKRVTKTQTSDKAKAAAGKPKAATDKAKGTKKTNTTRGVAPAKATSVGKASNTAKASKAKEPQEAARTAKAVKAGKTAKAGNKATRGKTPTAAKSAKGASDDREPRQTALPKVEGADVKSAIEVATEEALVPGDRQVLPVPAQAPAGRTRRGQPAAVNDPLTFLTFVSDHPIGSRLSGKVASFTSHGAMVDVGDMRCYAPLSRLGDPPPGKARDVLTRGETRDFVLVALDPPRRGAEVALPEMASERSGEVHEKRRIRSRQPGILPRSAPSR